MVVEGNPPWTRKDCDEFQLRMLRSCEVPGLLRLEAEALDGCVAFRYSLDGTRMLSALLRTDKWTMADWMTVLCRMAEILEDCRLYVLDEDRIVLDEDWIFVGEGWHDLKLAYLPLQGDRLSLGERLHMLMIRWLVHVKEPDGRVLQQLLQLSSSPDFKPSALRSFARQYLADQSQVGKESDGKDLNPVQPSILSGQSFVSDSDAQSSPSGSSGWRWFQPNRSDAQALSGLLGSEHESFPSPELPDLPNEPEESKRGRGIVWGACAAVGIAAMAWRWGYAEHPGMSGLIFSAGMTLAAAGGFVFLRRRLSGDHRNPLQKAGDGGEPPKSRRALPHEVPMGTHFSGLPKNGNPAVAQDWALEPVGPQTVMLNQTEDGTGLLPDGENGDPEAAPCCLLWETAPGSPLIPLTSGSFVIGRSREACAHVDDTNGISRAHLELLRTADGWTVKDLGSRNGSKLNGVPMVAYASYPFGAEDCLELAGSRYRLKVGKTAV